AAVRLRGGAQARPARHDGARRVRLCPGRAGRGHGWKHRHARPPSRPGAAVFDLAERGRGGRSADARGPESGEGSRMTLVDDRGRLFGRFNPVDVFLFALVVVMIPVAYGAYALFRTPPAKLGAVEPKQFTMGPNLRVRVDGTNLRPFMRVSFNNVQGRTFM